MHLWNQILFLRLRCSIIHFQMLTCLWISVERKNSWYAIWRSLYADRWHREGHRTDVTTGSWNQYVSGNAAKGCFHMCSFFWRLSWFVFHSHLFRCLFLAFRKLYFYSRQDLRIQVGIQCLQISFFRLVLD